MRNNPGDDKTRRKFDRLIEQATDAGRSAAVEIDLDVALGRFSLSIITINNDAWRNGLSPEQRDTLRQVQVTAFCESRARLERATGGS